MNPKHPKRRQQAARRPKAPEADTPTAPATPPHPPGPAMDFDFQGRTVRTVMIRGETWFVAADVCAVLEHSDTSMAVARLDEDEKGTNTVGTLGGEQQMLTVNESGLYALILTSRKPQARAFRRWVTGEVLPCIRKMGRYSHSEASGEAAKPTRRLLRVELPDIGRYVVLARPNGQVNVRRTAYYDAVVQEATNTDCRILSCQLTMIEALWHKQKHINSFGVGLNGGFAHLLLDDAILKGGELGQHFLRAYPAGEPEQERHEHDNTA